MMPLLAGRLYLKYIINKKMLNNKYCNSLIKYSRWKTREVLVGNVGIGGDNPIRIQSMTIWTLKVL